MSSPCRTSSSCTRSVLPSNWEERLPPRKANLLNPWLVIGQMALAFVPSSWIKELSEDEFREAMQVK